MAFSDTQELLRYLEEQLYVEDLTGSESGILSFGDGDPQGETGREFKLHVLRDVSERPIGFRVWSRDQYVDFGRFVVGELRLYVPGAVPDGWFIANGTQGTPDLTGKSPDESVAYYQFRGF